MNITNAFNNVNLGIFNSNINTRIQDLISNIEILKSTFQNVDQIIDTGLNTDTSEHILNLKEGETDVGQFKKTISQNEIKIEFIYQKVLFGKYSLTSYDETINVTKHSSQIHGETKFFSIKNPNMYFESKSKDIEVINSYKIELNNKSLQVDNIPNLSTEQLREHLIKRFINKSNSNLDSPYKISRYEDNDGVIYLRLTFKENESKTLRKFQREGDIAYDFNLIQMGDNNNPSIQDIEISENTVDIFNGNLMKKLFAIKTSTNDIEIDINLYRGIEEVEQTEILGNFYKKTKKLSYEIYNNGSFQENDVNSAVIVNEKENLNFGFIFNAMNDEQLQQMIREWLAIIIYEAKKIQLNIEINNSKILIISTAKDENGNIIIYDNQELYQDFDKKDQKIDWYSIQDSNFNIFDFYLRPTLFFNIRFDKTFVVSDDLSIHMDINSFINKLMTYDYSSKEYYFANQIIGNLHLENINKYNSEGEKLSFERNLNTYMEENKCLLNNLTKQSYEFSYVTHYKTFNDGETTQIIDYNNEIKSDTKYFLIDENILLENMAGICGDPHILTFGGNRLELPHIENKFNLLTYDNLIINTETYFRGKEVFLKNIKIYYDNKELLINLSNLELDKELDNFKVNSRSKNSIEICTYDNLFKFIFNSEINGFIVKSYEDLNQSNSKGILMSNYFDNCIIENL